MRGTEDIESPLAQAILQGDADTVHLLLRHGADPREYINPILFEEMTKMELYHSNIYYCTNILSEEDAMERLKIGESLINTGAQPSPNPIALNAVLEQNRNNDVDVGIIGLRHSTARQLTDRLKKKIPTMAAIARRAMLDRLRGNAEGHTIVRGLLSISTS